MQSFQQETDQKKKQQQRREKINSQMNNELIHVQYELFNIICQTILQVNKFYFMYTRIQCVVYAVHTQKY